MKVDATEGCALLISVARQSGGRMIGAAGEHYVLSMLLRQGFVASLAPVGTKGIDILLTDRSGNVSKTLQVKTSTNKRHWQVKKSCEDFTSPNLFYALVAFPKHNMESEEIFIVPSHLISKLVKESHELWLKGEPTRGRTRNDGNKRAIRRDFSTISHEMSEYGSDWLEQYRNGWESLR